MRLWERVLDALKNRALKTSPVEAFNVFFIFGLYAPDLFSPVILSAFVIMGLFVGVCVLLRRNKWEALVIWAMVFGFLCALGFRHYETGKALKNLEHFQNLLFCFSKYSSSKSAGVLWEGRIEGFVEKYPDKIRFLARIKRVSREDGRELLSCNGRCDLRIHVFISNPSRRWQYGERFIAKSIIKEYRDFRNPSPPFYQDLEKSSIWKGIWGYTFIKDDRDVIINESALSVLDSLFRWIDIKRQGFSDYVDRSISYPGSALLKAVTVGYRSFIDDNLNELITVAGVQHLLAISGLHLMVVALFSFWIIRLILRKTLPGIFLIIPEPIISVILSFPFVACYAVFAGFTAPTQRALFSVVSLGLGILLFRRITFLTAFSFAAVIILVADLSLLYSPSFILSFVAVAGINWVALSLRPVGSLKPLSGDGSKIGRHLIKIRNSFLDIFWISLCVQTVLCPFLIYFFLRFCWAGLLTNVFLVPYVSLVVLPLSITTLVAFLINPVLADLFSGAVGFFLDPVISTVKIMGSLRWSVFWGIPKVSSPVTAKFCILLYLVILCFVVMGMKKRRYPVVTVTIALFFMAFSYQSLIALSERKAVDGLEVVVFDVGDGNSTFIALGDGKTILIDGGGIPNSRFNPGMRILAPAIMTLGFRHVNDVILSHYHHDHVMGLNFFVKAFPVRNFVEPLCVPADSVSDLSHEAIARGLNVISFAQARNELESKGGPVKIIHPSPDPMAHCKNLNDSSTVIKLGYFNTSFVVTSDIGQGVLRKILPDLSRKNDETFIMLTPHHGRCSSFGEDLYDKISPDAVIISAKHTKNVPCPDLLKWCAKRNIPWFGTFRDGAIRLKSDGKGWAIYGTDEKRTFHFLARVEHK